MIRALYVVFVAMGVASAIGLYLFDFDRLSEEALMRLSFTWITPVIFGVAGLIAQAAGSRRHLTIAAVSAVSAAGATALFLLFIFPAL